MEKEKELRKQMTTEESNPIIEGELQNSPYYYHSTFSSALTLSLTPFSPTTQNL